MQNIPQKNLWDISYLYRNDEKRFVSLYGTEATPQKQK